MGRRLASARNTARANPWRATVLLCGLLAQAAAAGSAAPGRPTPAHTFLAEAWQKLDDGTFGPDDQKRCVALLGNATAGDRPGLALVLARYARVSQANPLEALKRLGPLIACEKGAAEWAAAQAKGERQARARERERAPKPADRPAVLFAEFPAVSDWQLDERNAACALEAAKCLLDLERGHQALAAVNRIGEKFTGMPRVLAAECGGDITAAMLLYKRAVEFYGFALKVLNSISSFGSQSSTDDERAARSRISRKLAEARRLLDSEKYGADWALYRDAEEKRRKDNDWVAALVLYDELRSKFAKTIWAEAATCYSVHCLLELSVPENARKARTAVEGAERAVQQARARLLDARRAGAPQAAAKALAEQTQQLESRASRMRSVPLADAALKRAQELAAAFLKENEYGLYRGEALLALATHALERQADPQKAQELHARAWRWLETVESLDAGIAALEVPEKAKAGSAAPATEDKKDAFGNIKPAEIPFGAVVNRQTCAWYLDDLREKCALATGFLHFAAGRNQEALKWYDKVLALDSKTAYLHRHGEWNNYRRLKWGADHGYLYAHPEELRLYQGRQRFAVLLADFYYVTERFGRSADLCKRLLAGEFGALSGPQRDYPQYALAACTYWSGDRRRAFDEYVKVLDRHEGTFTELRATYAAGNISWHIPDEAIQERGLELLRTLAFSGRQHYFVYRAMIVYGQRLIQSGKAEQGLRVLRSVPKQANEYYELARHYLREHEAERR